MACQLEVEEQEHALVFRVEEAPSWPRAAVAAIATGGVVGLAANWLGAPISLLLPAAAAAAAIAFLGAMRPSHAELCVTNLEYISCGAHTATWFRSEIRIPRASVRWLEYREDERGPESDTFGGVCAKGKYTATCVLPYVDEAQAIEVIERIERKFVAVAGQGSEESPFGPHFTRLDLDGR